MRGFYQLMLTFKIRRSSEGHLIFFFRSCGYYDSLLHIVTLNARTCDTVTVIKRSVYNAADSLKPNYMLSALQNVNMASK